MALRDIDTIVIAIMENRSFDHMLGYLSLAETPDPIAVDGLQSDPAWRKSFANPFAGKTYEVKPLPVAQRIDDPPHGFESIAMQIDRPPVGPGHRQMGGFVESYATFTDKKKPPPADLGAVMGYYDRAAVPAFDFLARNFCVCDRWFAALPLGTQANRLMAMAGESRLVNNSGFPIPEHPLVYDWLSKDKGKPRTKWCVYQSGGFLPFFTLMAKWIPEIVGSLTLSDLGVKGRFRRYSRLKKDWKSKDAMPSVIFVEPEYGDGPHKAPNDDHPPTGVAPGQALLMDLYTTLASNPGRWAKTLLIITYDEHGGFFDHVPPLKIETMVAGRKFETSGVRVPAFLVSPHVAAGSVFHEPLDHTSILQLLDDRFASGKGYSIAVNKRAPFLGRISNALLAVPRTEPAPGLPTALSIFADVIKSAVSGLVSSFARQPVEAPAAAAATPRAPDTPNSEALDEATRKFAHDHPELIHQPGWQGVRQYLGSNLPPDPNPELQK